MKKVLLSMLLPMLFLSACDNDLVSPSVRGVGPTESETRTLNSFSKVELKINAEVVLTQGPTQEVRIEAQRNILDVLETELSGDKLEIEYGHYNVRSHDPVKVYITVPSLSEVEVAGSGKIRSAGPWTASSFRTHVSGSGEIIMSFAKVDGLRTNVSGSGEVRLSGVAQSHNTTISGSGKIYAYELASQDTYASISGSGKTYVAAARTLEVDLSGSGSVYYRGNPKVSSRISGSGKVLAED
ncbi:head GIN domain-containing protein [Hymenobacter crusticola]|uniref:Putative auto-transporter adhesin head GIN domain-containing protein n=1 Tax=Hymenobacter crusticola TaxID=1770526 RepID=A0A243WKC1_9BACT|nr:head GIN domain-containing protein [Hymenobacter crusticola]OUJ76060.1 hypothetical protein BXP70_01940 [Hymenobacter crusticola]